MLFAPFAQYSLVVPGLFPHTMPYAVHVSLQLDRPAGGCKLNWTATGQRHTIFATLLRQQCVDSATAPGQTKSSVVQAMYAHLYWSWTALPAGSRECCAAQAFAAQPYQVSLACCQQAGDQAVHSSIGMWITCWTLYGGVSCSCGWSCSLPPSGTPFSSGVPLAPVVPMKA